MSSSSSHVVIPGQVIASSSSGVNDNDTEEPDFLRGHGTYVEKYEEKERLVASVAGTVTRVNKLISVVPYTSCIYTGQVGDLVVGRITSVQSNRWKVQLLSGNKEAQLPLSGVQLPGGVQRVRTAEDRRDMRQLFLEGDLVSAEVHSITQDGSLLLHTRSLKYGKLQNGCLVCVPPALIPRLQQHFVKLQLLPDGVKLTVLLGMNGYIWIQRSLVEESSSSDVVEWQEKQQQRHASTEVDSNEREAIARVRNAIQCLSMIHTMMTPDNIESVCRASIEQNVQIGDMLQPNHVLELTKVCRKK